MRIGRAATATGIVRGTIEDGRITTEDGDRYDLGDDDVELVSPCDPSIVYCIGRNYPRYLEQRRIERPAQPHFFLKPPVSVWNPGAIIPYPTFADGVRCAGELAVVVAEECSKLSPDEVPDAIAGYTIVDDVDAVGEPEAAMKVFRGSAPLGPWIETDLDPLDLHLETRVDGEVEQRGHTEDMVFDPFEIVSFLSGRVPLRAGDVIAFGSPAAPASVSPGEDIEIRYAGIGTLENALGEPTA